MPRETADFHVEFVEMKFQDGIFPTTAWSAGPGCHGGCGQKIIVENGKMVKIEGNEEHPFNQGRSCPKVLALKQYMYHPDRITTPLKRVGAKGAGKFQRISWDEALDTIETRMKAIREQYGPEAVVFAQGTGRDIGGPITFLCYSFGSPNWCQFGLSGQSCYTPRLGCMKAMYGDFLVADCAQFSEQRYNDPAWVRPEAMIVWGQNPLAGCPDGFMGHWVVDLMKMGTKIISIDPRQTWLTSRAEVHLPLRPGTDGALALAMLNVIIGENLQDEAFIKNHVHGFDELKAHVKPWTPQKAAEICWVEPEKIVQAARLYATAKPASIHWGVTVDMCPEATDVCRAICSLYAVTGNVDNPGGNVIARPAFNVANYPYTLEELKELYGEELINTLNEKRIGADKYPMVKGFRAWAQPDMCMEQMLSGKPYPIKGMWIQSANVLGGQAFNTKRHYEAMQKLDFVAVADLFHNPTTMAFADIIVPSATFPEKNSLRAWWAPLTPINKVVQVDECRSDWEINFELARRFNPSLPYKTVEDFFDSCLANTVHMTYQELQEHNNVGVMPPQGHNSRPYFRQDEGLLRKDGHKGFGTSSGKVELYSEQFKEWGLSPLPNYVEPWQSPVENKALAAKYPLIMIAGTRTQLTFHAEHRMIPWLREKNQWPLVDIHPADAAKYDVYDGEWIWLANDLGKVKRKVNITKTVRQGMINTQHGWWLPEMEGAEPSLFGVWDYQVNQLTHGPQQCSAGYGGGQYKVTLVKIEKMTEVQ